jgi:hypothetical protein
MILMINAFTKAVQAILHEYLILNLVSKHHHALFGKSRQ